MTETKVIKSTSGEPERRWLKTSPFGSHGLFGPSIPFGDVFGVNPFALMREFTREMDRAFSTNGESWIPAIEVKEANGNLLVSADLPGIKTADVKVEVTDDALTIQGERKQEKKEEKEGVYRSERSYGRFYRLIPLPDGAKTDQIKAEMNNGILEVRIPMPETKQKGRQIPVSETGGAKEQQKKTTAA